MHQSALFLMICALSGQFSRVMRQVGADMTSYRN
ncbi:hypothetical protein KPNJ1_03059 [Klebsiella pneumoniae 30660/NJST258_1]|nr:hypothetical protein KPNJ1_03059 [Klebsiella pneumoniae 30660/NJST258_1]